MARTASTFVAFFALLIAAAVAVPILPAVDRLIPSGTVGGTTYDVGNGISPSSPNNQVVVGDNSQANGGSGAFAVGNNDKSIATQNANSNTGGYVSAQGSAGLVGNNGKAVDSSTANSQGGKSATAVANGQSFALGNKDTASVNSNSNANAPSALSSSSGNAVVLGSQDTASYNGHSSATGNNVAAYNHGSATNL